MKKLVLIVFVILGICVTAGIIYWQYHKKKIIKDSIANAIAKKTDSLYYLHYDSSHIDELNGNASFFNVALQSDSAQKAQLNSTDSLPNVLYNISVKQVAVSGVDIPGLMSKQTVAAKKIVLLNPVILIIRTGTNQLKPYTRNDTLELYQKILGKFSSIKTDTIQVSNGTLLITDRSGKAQTTVEKINITLQHFLVDSTKDYQSILSYFITDIHITVDNIQLPVAKNNTSINLEKIDYNAYKRSLQIGSVKQYQHNNMQAVIDLKNIQVNDLNTNAFIIQQRLKAGQINCDGGLITIYTSQHQGASKTGNESLELSTDMIDQAQTAGINLGSTKVLILNKDNPGKPPFVLNNVRFKVTNQVKIMEGTTINNLINNSEWQLSGDAFSFITKDKLYKLTVGDFVIDNASSVVKVKSILLKPLLTEEQFVDQSHQQHDLYNLTINNVVLSGVNTRRLVNMRELEVEEASFQPVIKIFNDRTLPPGGESKIGNYPQQSLLKLAAPLYIHTAHISNGLVSYREKASKSKLTGNVFFSNIDATILNLTNIPERIKVNSLLKVHATAKFLAGGNLSTDWQFPLTAKDGAFTISGELAAMNATTLNSITEPLAMASVNQGQVDELKFAIDGTDRKANGNILFLYHDLKMELLKIGNEEELKKKGLLSALANTLIKNENTNATANKKFVYERDITRSFFNLVWKTVFTGVKNTALGK